jgi:hypothetical protein
MMLRLWNRFYCLSSISPAAVEKTSVYPPPPNGGHYKHQKINKSPLRDLGVEKQKEGFNLRTL